MIGRLDRKPREPMKRPHHPRSGTMAAAIAITIMVLALLVTPHLNRNRGSERSIADNRPSMSGSEWPTKRYPVMVQRLGAQTFDRAALYVPQIARLVDGKKACDRVTTVEMAISSTPRSVRYLASCNNGYRDRIDVDFTATKSA